jgi:hypothetical protein
MSAVPVEPSARKPLSAIEDLVDQPSLLPRIVGLVEVEEVAWFELALEPLKRERRGFVQVEVEKDAEGRFEVDRDGRKRLLEPADVPGHTRVGDVRRRATCIDSSTVAFPVRRAELAARHSGSRSRLAYWYRSPGPTASSRTTRCCRRSPAVARGTANDHRFA